METAPKALRLQIALMGRVNAGKSSFLNLICGQDAAVTSNIAGTTTDVVEKNQELLPIGPITWLDTAGFGDESELSGKRLEKTMKVFNRANIIVLVTEGNKNGKIEDFILEEAAKQKIPVIRIFNKADLYNNEQAGIWVNSQDKSSRDAVLNILKAELLKICPEEFIKTPPLYGDLLPQNGSVLLLVPIDKEAPKGRLILPQVQAIREGLDYNLVVTVVKEDRYIEALQQTKPDLVICDSQVVDFMVMNTPAEIKCTTFSILFARLKGDLNRLVQGAAAIANLKSGDKILISECCTHHAIEDDIGKVKIPNLLKKKSGKDLEISHTAGRDFPEGVGNYKLVVQCGGCMFGRREILCRINHCTEANVPITNYGVCISELKGVLERVLAPFPEALKLYKKIKG